MKRISKLVFEQDVDCSQLNRFIGKNCSEISSELNLQINLKKRMFARQLVDELLKSSNVCVNEKEISVRVIRIDEFGNAKNPSPMKVYSYEKIMEEEWENSMLKQILSTTHMFFVITHGSSENSIFKGCFVYNFNNIEMESAKIIWKDTRDKILNRDYYHFLTDKDTGTFFFKTHANNSNDLVKTSNGGYQIRRSFWISKILLTEIIRKQLSKN